MPSSMNAIGQIITTHTIVSQSFIGALKRRVQRLMTWDQTPQRPSSGVQRFRVRARSVKLTKPLGKGLNLQTYPPLV